jgi:hypothetical protein
MNNQKAIDLNYGFKSEEQIHEFLEEIFGTLFNSKNNPEMGQYYEYDKYNEKYFIEMKTRRIFKKQYPTLFFGKNKLIKGDEILKKNPNLRIFYLWRCKDGVVGWEHRSSPFEINKRGRWDRGKEEIDDCVDILQEYIKPINKLLSEDN